MSRYLDLVATLTNEELCKLCKCKFRLYMPCIKKHKDLATLFLKSSFFYKS